jgi:hypothetical protein
VEHLAADLGITTSLAFDKIRQLEEAEQLFGVTDDRGKYVAVTPMDLHNLRLLIRSRGKTSIHDVRKMCADVLSRQLEVQPPMLTPESS